MKILSNISEIEEKILKWIKDEEWSHEKINEFDTFVIPFAYAITLNNSIKLFIGIEKALDRFTIQHKITIAEDSRNSYKLSLKKQDFFYDLKITLMLMGIGIDINPNIEEIQSMELSKFIYLDEFSRNKVINSILKMGSAAQLCMIKWTKFIKESLSMGRPESS